MSEKLCNELLNYIKNFDLESIKDFQMKNLTFNINKCLKFMEDDIVNILAEDRSDEGIENEEKFSLLEILLKDLDLNPNVKDGDLMYYAIIYNDYDIIELLDNYGYNINKYYEDVILYALDEISDDSRDEIEEYIESLILSKFKR